MWPDIEPMRHYLSTPSNLFVSTDGVNYNPVHQFDGDFYTSTLNTERKNNMDVRDKICDKCGKRYSIANMRIETEDGYADKTCYVDNRTPIENYPKLKHSVGEKYIGADMDLCSECAEELKKFAGED